MSDDDLPERFKDASGAISARAGGALPRMSGFGAKMAAWEAEQNLKFERIEVEREHNNARYIDALRESDVAQYKLDTVQDEKHLIDVRRADEAARLAASTQSAVTAAKAEISNLDAVIEDNHARREEAKNRRLRAAIENKALEEKLSGSTQDLDQKIDAVKSRQRRTMIEAQELEQELEKLLDKADKNDPAMNAKIRVLRAEYLQNQDEVERLGRRLEELLGDL